MNALIPGSFDPITLGHLNIIERASPMFEKIYVAVMNNDSGDYDKSLVSKKNMFDGEQRLDMVKLTIEGIDNAFAVYYPGRLIDFCDEYDICAVIRGVRTARDFEYEMIHAAWNRKHNKKAQALFMPADEKFDYISSTAVRKIIEEKNDYYRLRGILAEKTIDYISNYFGVLK